MKYGVLFFRKTENIGDDIQSYAALRFLPSIDYEVNRERLDTFSVDHNTQESVSVIMNGWYMHDKTAWPPSSNINPLWISYHACQAGGGTRELQISI